MLGLTRFGWYRARSLGEALTRIKDKITRSWSCFWKPAAVPFIKMSGFLGQDSYNEAAHQPRSQECVRRMWTVNSLDGAGRCTTKVVHGRTDLPLSGETPSLIISTLFPHSADAIL